MSVEIRGDWLVWQSLALNIGSGVSKVRYYDSGYVHDYVLVVDGESVHYDSQDTAVEDYRRIVNHLASRQSRGGPYR